jgi:hypothetical protein
MEVIDVEVLENNQIDSYPTTLLRLQLVYSKLRHDIERLLAPHPIDWVFENSNWIDTFFVEAWKEIKENYLKRHSSRKNAYNSLKDIK